MITMHGKAARSGFRTRGRRPDRKKAVVTLLPGQILEDIGA
jgi:ribosomal protein L23